ncbi:hypothetical protein MITS9504_03123 [Synechococcus sp. MIT S9504]|nr:hypothetical protein MITS9504_03123 [Synechococcus sp. MIT S9504]
MLKDLNCFWKGCIYTLKALALAGAFYFFNHPKKISNQPPITGMIERYKY